MYPLVNESVSGFQEQTLVRQVKLGLLPYGKRFEVERERVKPLERNERVCEGHPDTDARLVDNS